MSKPGRQPHRHAVLWTTVCLAIAAGVPARPSSARAEPAGAYYTARQATAGAQDYALSCSRCHGAQLQGVGAPPLIGPGFRNRWPVRTLYHFVSHQMPADRRGSLSPAKYDAIVAFLLQRNGHPAGAVPLNRSRASAITTKL